MKQSVRSVMLLGLCVILIGSLFGCSGKKKQELLQVEEYKTQAVDYYALVNPYYYKLKDYVSYMQQADQQFSTREFSAEDLASVGYEGGTYGLLLGAMTGDQGSVEEAMGNLYDEYVMQPAYVQYSVMFEEMMDDNNAVNQQYDQFNMAKPVVEVDEYGIEDLQYAVDAMQQAWMTVYDCAFDTDGYVVDVQNGYVSALTAAYENFQDALLGLEKFVPNDSNN